VEVVGECHSCIDARCALFFCPYAMLDAVGCLIDKVKRCQSSAEAVYAGSSATPS